MASDSIQDQVLQAKLSALQTAPATLQSNFANHTPTDSHPFFVNSQPFPAYPAPGGGTTQLLSYKVPEGMIAVITSLVILAIGGGFSDGSGNVVWRCWQNQYGIDGLEDITAHVGSFDDPVPIQIVLNEHDVFFITVEVPAGQNPMPPGATTGARIQGWTIESAKVSG
jgi:hypothetical protein